MKLLTVRDFRSNTSSIWKELQSKQDLVLTNNGKPMALLVPVNEDNLEDTLRMARRNRAERAVHNIRMQAERTGLSKMSMDEINTLVAEVREELRREKKR